MNKRTKESILKEWSKLTGKSCIGEVSEEDKLAFKKIVFEEKISKEIPFVIGPARKERKMNKTGH